MPFIFSLESLLRFRISQERAERLKLEAIVAEQSRIRAWIEDLAGAAIEAQAAFQQRLASGVTGADLQLELSRLANFDLARNQLRTRLAEAEQQRVTQAEAFVRARRNREILEELRRRKLREYRLHEARREQQDLDDLFLMRREEPA